jgi:ABC-type nitrate/sulfonate/bicarbonate transport system substrate-binding protein
MVASHKTESTRKPAAKPRAARAAEPATLRIGFVPLVDAAPLIAAHEQGYFADEGLSVTLHRQIGWANIRDKITFGVLDAGHALLGVPLQSHLDAGVQPLVGIMSLGTGGNAITISNSLHDAGIRVAADIKRWTQLASGGRRLTFGHVFGASMHHYLLRDWLASGGINPDADVRLRVIPPPQMPAHMAAGYVDGFCVGEPWNAVADRAGIGKTILQTTDILPNHPEKVLAVSAATLRQKPDALRRMIRAILRGCLYGHDPANHAALARTLSANAYIHQPPDIILQCLTSNFDIASTFPSRTHILWLLTQMARWGHAPAEINVETLVAQCCDTTAYRAAAADLGIPCPPSDAPPMPLRNGSAFTTEYAAHLMTTLRRAAATKIEQPLSTATKERAYAR